MRVMISCGEPSGDLYAGALVAALRQQHPGVEVFGLGGERLKAAGGRLVADFGGLSVTGITEALSLLPRFYRVLRRLIAAARETRPDVFVAIDFPDFNFHLLAAIRKLGIPTVYYISPQLWAWRPNRMEKMQRLVDRVLVIFPFEEPLYQAAGVPVRFVGHPLVDLAHCVQPRSAFLRDTGLVPERPTVGLLPGSRSNELRRHVPSLVAAIQLIRAQMPDTQFVVACAPSLPEELFAPFAGTGAVLVRGRTDDVLAASDVVVTASGTATVQAALHECPMVVVYRLSRLTYWIGKPLVKVNTYAMPNLVAGTHIVPELIQEAFTPSAVAEEALRLLSDPKLHARTREALRRVREKLGASGASDRAAAEVLGVGRKAEGRRQKAERAKDVQGESHDRSQR